MLTPHVFGGETGQLLQSRFSRFISAQRSDSGRVVGKRETSIQADDFRIARDSGGRSKFTQNPGPAEEGPTDDTAVPKTSQGDSVMTVVTSAGSPF